MPDGEVVGVDGSVAVAISASSRRDARAELPLPFQEVGAVDRAAQIEVAGERRVEAEDVEDVGQELARVAAAGEISLGDRLLEDVQPRVGEEFEVDQIDDVRIDGIRGVERIDAGEIARNPRLVGGGTDRVVVSADCIEIDKVEDAVEVGVAVGEVDELLEDFDVFPIDDGVGVEVELMIVDVRDRCSASLQRTGECGHILGVACRSIAVEVAGSKNVHAGDAFGGVLRIHDLRDRARRRVRDRPQLHLERIGIGIGRRAEQLSYVSRPLSLANDFGKTAFDVELEDAATFGRAVAVAKIDGPVGVRGHHDDRRRERGVGFEEFSQLGNRNRNRGAASSCAIVGDLIDAPNVASAGQAAEINRVDAGVADDGRFCGDVAAHQPLHAAREGIKLPQAAVA